MDAEQVDAEQVDVEPVDAEQVDAEQVDVEPVDAEQVDVEPVDAEPVHRSDPRPRTPSEPVLPRSPDESDSGWGEPDSDDDERLRREVPPHW